MVRQGLPRVPPADVLPRAAGKAGAAENTSYHDINFRRRSWPWARNLLAAAGQPAIPAESHIRLASFEHNGGTRILRRGYSFTDGIDPQAGTLLGGLFFIAFMKNPAQFIRLQQALAADALNEYIHHTGSAVFACPPGIRPGQHWGDGLFT